MAINFPENPALNDDFIAENGNVYIFDGEKWVGAVPNPNYADIQGATGPEGPAGPEGPGGSIDSAGSYELANLDVTGELAIGPTTTNPHYKVETFSVTRGLNQGPAGNIVNGTTIDASNYSKIKITAMARYQNTDRISVDERTFYKAGNTFVAIGHDGGSRKTEPTEAENVSEALLGPIVDSDFGLIFRRVSNTIQVGVVFLVTNALYGGNIQCTIETWSTPPST